MGVRIYTQAELEELRLAISHLPFLDEAEARSTSIAVASGQCKPHLSPFWSLADTHNELWRKLGQDHLLENYSIYGFFPGIYELVYQQECLPTITYSGRSRGRVALIQGDEIGRVISPYRASGRKNRGFTEEGLQRAARRLGESTVAPFRLGFEEAYR